MDNFASFMRSGGRPAGRVPLIPNFNMDSFLHYMAVMEGGETEGAEEIKTGLIAVYDKYVRDAMGLLETVGPGKLVGGELPRRTRQQEVFIDKICILLKKPEAEAFFAPEECRTNPPAPGSSSGPPPEPLLAALRAASPHGGAARLSDREKCVVARLAANLHVLTEIVAVRGRVDDPCVDTCDEVIETLVGYAGPLVDPLVGIDLKNVQGLLYLAYRLGAAVAVAARIGWNSGPTIDSLYAKMVSSLVLRVTEILSAGLPRVPGEGQNVLKSYHPDVFKHEEAIDVIMRRSVADLARSALIKPYTSSTSSVLSVLPSTAPFDRKPSGPRAACRPMLASQLWTMYKMIADYSDYRTGAGLESAKTWLTSSPLFLVANTASFEYISRHFWSCGSPSSIYCNAPSRRVTIAQHTEVMAELSESFGWKELPSFVAARALALWTMGMLRALPELAREDVLAPQLCINLCANGSVHPSDAVRILGHTILDPMSAIFDTPLGVRQRLDWPAAEKAMLEMAFAAEVQSAGPFLLLMLSRDPVARRTLIDRYRHLPGGPSVWACPAIKGQYSILGHAVRRLTVSGSQCWERLGRSGVWTSMDSMNMLYRLGMMGHLGSREEQAIMRLAAAQPLRVYIILQQAAVKDEPFPGMRPELGRLFDLLAWHRKGEPASLARAAERCWGLLAHPIIDLKPMIEYALKVLPTRSSVPWACLSTDGLTKACLVSDMSALVASLGRALHFALQSKSAAAAQGSGPRGAVPDTFTVEETKAQASVERIKAWKDQVKSATRALLRIHIPIAEKGAVRALRTPSRPEALAAGLNVEVDWEGLGEAKAAEKGWRRPGVEEFLGELRVEAGRVGAVSPKALRRLESGDSEP